MDSSLWAIHGRWISLIVCFIHKKQNRTNKTIQTTQNKKFQKKQQKNPNEQII